MKIVQYLAKIPTNVTFWATLHYIKKKLKQTNEVIEFEFFYRNEVKLMPLDVRF